MAADLSSPPIINGEPPRRGRREDGTGGCREKGGDFGGESAAQGRGNGNAGAEIAAKCITKLKSRATPKLNINVAAERPGPMNQRSEGPTSLFVVFVVDRLRKPDYETHRCARRTIFPPRPIHPLDHRGSRSPARVNTRENRAPMRAQGIASWTKPIEPLSLLYFSALPFASLRLPEATATTIECPEWIFNTVYPDSVERRQFDALPVLYLAFYLLRPFSDSPLERTLSFWGGLSAFWYI